MSSKFERALAQYDAGHFEKAFELFHAEAEAGDASSMLHIGSMYSTGEGVACDYRKALEWERRAVSLGEPSAEVNLGITYRFIGDLRQSRKCFERALAAGDEEAALELAKLLLVCDHSRTVVRDYLEIVVAGTSVCEASREEAESLLNELAPGLPGGDPTAG